LEDIEALALRHAFDNVDEDNVGELLIGDTNGAVRADISCPNHGDLFAHR
jgi:hypothetical protein